MNSERARSALNAHAPRPERENAGEPVEVSVHVEHVGRMLLGAGSHKKIGQGQALLAARGKLTLGRGGDGEGLGVHAKRAESVECGLEVTVVGRRSRAEEHFETRDGAYAELSVLRWRRLAAEAHEG